MNEIKYQIVNVILLALLGFGIYWAFTTIDNGIYYDKNADVVASTEIENEIIPDEEVILFENTQTDTETTENTGEETTTVKPTSTADTNSVITALQKLVDTNTILKSGSDGDGATAIQKFLAIYFPDKKIIADGDFGPGTEKLVKEFQNKELNGGDGRVGPNTAKKMIEILKK